MNSVRDCVHSCTALLVMVLVTGLTVLTDDCVDDGIEKVLVFRSDRLVGHVLGLAGHLPDIFTEVEISFFLLRRLLGVKTDGDKKRQSKVCDCCEDGLNA